MWGRTSEGVRIQRRGGVHGPLLVVSAVVIVTSACLVLWHPFAGAPRRQPAARATLGVAVAVGTYAFVRSGQIYLAGPSGTPRQLTAFASADHDPTHWGPLVWAPDNHHLAVAVGSPLVPHDRLGGAAGVLYVIDTRSGVAQTIAPERGASGIAVGPSAYAWRDAKTLLFAAAGHVYTYSMSAGTTALVPGLVGGAVEIAVRAGAVYYSSAAVPDGPLLALPITLRRHDLATGHDAALAELGTGRFEVTGCDAVGCEAAMGVPSAVPAWDVSTDGSAMAYQTVTSVAADDSTLSASFWYASLTNGMPHGAPVRLFSAARTSLPADTPGACCFLRFAPIGGGLVLSGGYAMNRVFGPYLVYTDSPGVSAQLGSPWAFGPAAWTPDARAFTLVSRQSGVAETSLLNFGDQSTAILRADASDCAWAWAAV